MSDPFLEEQLRQNKILRSNVADLEECNQRLEALCYEYKSYLDDLRSESTRRCMWFDGSDAKGYMSQIMVVKDYGDGYLKFEPLKVKEIKAQDHQTSGHASSVDPVVEGGGS
jgi:hypothetical protein